MRDRFDETKISARDLVICILILVVIIVIHWLNYAKH